MGKVKKAGGTVVLVIFLFLTVLRPLFTNPALARAGVDEILRWPQVLLYAPLLSVMLVLFVLGVFSLLRGDGLPAGRGREGVGTRQQSGATEADIDDEQLQRFEEHPDLSSRFLSGQGGTRETDFGIEEEPPDATLGDHLDHLQSELGDEEGTREDLQTLADVVAETEDEQPIPPRCPQEYCDAAWSERTILGVKNGRYKLLDNGEQVQCLECESIYTLERSR